jgi:hypothetical protein
MVKKRLKMVAQLGYAYIGTRDASGEGWFSRTVSEVETLANALLSTTHNDMFGDVPEDPSELKIYEVARAMEMSSTFQARAKKFVKPHELPMTGELSVTIAELYHYEEALRCKAVPNPHSLNALAAEDEPRPAQHAPSLPKIAMETIDTLLAFPKKMSEVLTPRESGIVFSLMEKAGLKQDLYAFGYQGPQQTAPIVVKLEFTGEVANDAIQRVMRMVTYAATHNRTAFRSIVNNMSKLFAVQTATQKAVANANAFIQSSSNFWRMMRDGDESCSILDTLAVDDVFVTMLSHLGEAECYVALALTCTQFNKNEALRGALPVLTTSVMTGKGCAGTLEVADGVPIIRTDMLIGFKTSFGYNKPKLDGPDEWVNLVMEPFTGGFNKGHCVVRVVLIYDEPGCSLVYKSREPVLRMGTGTGDKLKGEFSFASWSHGIQTPVKILTTSRSVNPVPGAVYDGMVAHWEATLAEQHTLYARKRLDEAKAVRDRNKTQQCMRVKIIVERNGRTMEAISEPFSVVANLSKAQKKQAAKRQKT